MSAPAELEALLAFAERPRAGDWSLRSALVRYAQPEPERVSRLLEVVRRIEHSVRVGRPAPVELVPAMVVLDGLGDVVAEWALDPSQPRPDAQVDAAVVEATRLLDGVGAPREERVRPPGARSRG